MNFDWNSGALAEGLQCYRREAFFLAHEHWEGVWLQCQQPEKTFMQALIQVAAAFHHLQRKNVAGASSLLKAALRRLERYPAFFGGIALTPFRNDVRAWIQLLEKQDALLHRPFPQICIDSAPDELSQP
jgi:predicted metal-dependent hydrolase